MREKPLILLVDDENNFLEIIGTKLKTSGFDVETAHSGDEAIRKSTEIMPDLILMDIHMPGMTGTDAALTIKQNDKTKDIKIAFLTSLNDPWPGLAGDRAEASKEMGMADFLKKDDDLDKIVAKVRMLLPSAPTSAVRNGVPPSAQNPAVPIVSSASSSPEDVSKSPNSSA